MIRNKNSIYQKLSAILLCVFLSLSMFVGCNVSNSSLTVTLSATQMTLQVNESKNLTATVSDGSTVTWTSEDETIATVTNNGVVKGKSVGETTITAKSGNASANCKITVKEAEDTTTKKRTAFSGGVGTSALFVGESIAVKPALTVEGEKQENIIAEYSSTNTNVAVVENGVLTAVSVGETTIKAMCTHNGAVYEDTKTLEVVEYNEDGYALVSINGKVQTGSIVCVNEKSIAEQFKIRIYTKDGIKDYSLVYASSESKVFTFNLLNGNGSVKLTLIDGNGNSLIGQTGEVNATLENNATTSATMQINSLTCEERTFNDSTSYQAFVKASNVYTDFKEFGVSESIANYFDYDFANEGGGLSIDNEITYNGTPSLKITIPKNMSSFYFKDLALNYQDYGLTIGSKISFKIRFDGAPKTEGSYYFSVGKITTVNGEIQESPNNISTSQETQKYVMEGNTQWRDVTFVLSEESFPLVDLGLHFRGNSKATSRCAYIACITIDNPDSVDYSVDFSRAVEWDNTGKNSKADWWGYSAGVSNAFKIENVPTDIATAYQTKFGSSLPTSVQVVAPNMRGVGANSEITKKVLQNSSCLFTNKMKGMIYQGNTKIKVRVYMQATGDLPATTSVSSLVFLREGGASGEGIGLGFEKNKLQTLSPNVWTEFIYEVPEGYLSADRLTVAFNLKNYYQCNENVVLKFYLGSISFVV